MQVYTFGMAKARRFILQAIDPDHGSPAFETMFTVGQIEELRKLLGDAAKDDPDLEKYYTLEPDELAAIRERFDVGFDPEGRESILAPWSQLRECPYLIHTGYELVLMLDGRKPFTRLGMDYYPSEFDFGEKYFDPYVEQGVLHKEVLLEKFDEPHRGKDGRVFEGFRAVFYTLKGEEWRIPAWKLVSRGSGGEGWNHTFERLEGMLLGYEDWQNAWHIERLRRIQQQFGTLLVHLAVTAEELAGIEHAGHRALPPMGRTLSLVTSFDEDPEDKEPHRLMDAVDIVALVRLRVKARAFLELVDEKQTRFHRLSSDRIPDLNRALAADIEVAIRR